MSRPSDPTSSAARTATALPVVGLLSLALAGASTWLGYRLLAERERTATLQAEVGRLRAENAALLAHVDRQGGVGRPAAGPGARIPGASPLDAGNDPRLAGLVGGPIPPAGASPGPAGGPGRGGSAGPAVSRSPGAGLANALHDPAAREAMRRQQVAALHRMYPDLAQALGLSREKADRFVDRLVEQQMRRMDESLQLADSGGARSSGEMKDAGERMAAARRDAERDLAAEFGADTLEAWKNYQQGLGARMELRDLQLELADAGLALTPAQRDALVAALVREQQLSGRAGSKKLPAAAQVAQAEASYQRLQGAARAVLSAEQFERFDARQRQRLQIVTSAAEASRTRSGTP